MSFDEKFKKNFERFKEIQKDAERENTNASLRWYFTDAKKYFKLMEYTTYIEKVEKIKEGNRERQEVTLRFANNETDKLLDYKGKVEKSKIYFSIGFFSGTCFNETWYFPISDFSETSLVGRYNHLKAYKETPKLELSKAEEIRKYNYSKAVKLQDDFYCTFDIPETAKTDAHGEIIY